MEGLQLPHHDGSALHVGNPAPSPGEAVPVFLRVPHGAAAGQVWVRRVIDGEPGYVEAVVDRATDTDTWWRADVTVSNDVVPYRFLLDGGPGGYRWVHANGIVGHDPTDAFDFRLSLHAPPPAWLDDTVAYQIFPDRFASSGRERPRPDWAEPARWDDPIAEPWTTAVNQLYGGDLTGIEQRLGHLEDLGVNLLYVTPFFPAESAHRYNATTFDRVDPLLGGDEALASLVKAAHARDMRVIGDLTTNHSGDTHGWFKAAQADAASDEASYYFFDAHPDDYVGWYGVPQLPKFDMRSPGLRQAMLEGPDSVVGRWLQQPFDLDGWRIDVANMTGRHDRIDVNREVARAIRATMAEVKPDTWLVAEHCYDASPDLAGDGWHGTMSYAGFTRPAWCWLGTRDVAMMGIPTGVPSFGGPAAVATMREFLAAMSWRAASASLVLLDSHDTARFRDAVGGDTDRQLVGVALQTTYPGVPMVFAGDEVGCGGADSDLARVSFPWDEARWDRPLLEGYRALVGVRRRTPALRRGGLRWVHAGADSLTFLRETADERVLVHLARAAHDPVVLDAALLGASRGEPLYGPHDLSADGGRLALPADGPAAHIWRLGA